MHIIVEDVGKDNQHAQCPHCKWNGLASDLKKGDYFSLNKITELFCPDCGKYMGFIQHDEVDSPTDN